MAILNKNDSGVVLTGQFNRSSPAAGTELKAFQARLEQIQKAQGFKHFVQAIDEEGDQVTVRIIPVKSGTPPTNTANRRVETHPAKVGWGQKGR